MPPPVIGSMFVSISCTLERVDERVLLLGEVAGLVLGAVLQRVLELVLLLLEDDRLDRVRIGVDPLGELVEGGDVLGLALADHAAGEEGQHEDDQDRERGAAEESLHARLPAVRPAKAGPGVSAVLEIGMGIGNSWSRNAQISVAVRFV